VHHLKLGELEFGGEKKYGFSFFPSFKVRGERSSSSFAELQGLPDVDRAIELGVGLQYEQADYRVFVEGRRGFSGHNGWNGEAGIDFKLATNTGWDFAVGPRISFADDRYSETYFSVETPTARLAAFDADSGIKSYGVAGSARYQITSQLAWENSLEYARLVGSAAKSPITQTRDQFTFRSGISYRFQIGY
jgi:outer membrane scaffolding protein for murein synthesis (MipA/OmpV family)